MSDLHHKQAGRTFLSDLHHKQAELPVSP